MTAPAGPQRAPGGLLGKLMAQVRPEFRVEVYWPDPGDPVLGRPLCAVPGCDRSGWAYRMCSGHSRRFVARSRPDMPVFLADPGPPLHGRTELSACTVAGCRSGVNGLGLCMSHRAAFTRSGADEPAEWAAAQPPVPAGDHEECGLPFCTLWTANRDALFCKSHHTRWLQLGSPDTDDYIEHCLRRGKVRIDFRPLAGQLRLEMQYAIQLRHDAKTISAPPTVVNWAIKIAASTASDSLLDHDEAWWRQRTADKANTQYPGFLLRARDAAQTLRDGTGWDVEYPRDVWRLHTLPGLVRNSGKSENSCSQIHFDRIAQPWLRDLTKRWARLRLTSGLTIGTVVIDVGALNTFSRFLTEVPEPVSLADVDRALLERYLAWNSSQPGGPGVKEDAITGLSGLLHAIRRHGWDQALPATAGFFTGDCPPRPPRRSRRLSEHVMAQLESPANLDRFEHRGGRLITIILMRCGLRASDACTLEFDCIVHDGQNAPYLRYINHKMRREAAVPIDEELETEIRAQQARVATRWPDSHPHLFPAPTRNVDGQQPTPYYSYRAAMLHWVTSCDIRDEHGDLVHITAHQWRHTFASRLINRDVPQEVVRVLLDHDSTEMTAHYARITDQTVRRRWEAATKVDVHGKPVTIDPDGPLTQAQWAKTRYGIATQTLPHGYCGLPVQKSCPHANACLTCPVFLTGPEFLPELREHRGRTLTLIDTAEKAGQQRVAGMNRQVLANLDKMITGVQTPTAEKETDAS